MSSPPEGSWRTIRRWSHFFRKPRTPTGLSRRIRRRWARSARRSPPVTAPRPWATQPAHRRLGRHRLMRRLPMTTERAASRQAAMSHALAAVRAGDTIRSQLAPVGDRESIGALLARNVARFGAHPVYCERRDGAVRAHTWDAFGRDVASFAAFLAAAGVKPGTRVAVVSPNRGEMLVAEFATMS